jgi:hypothetical protein
MESGGALTLGCDSFIQGGNQEKMDDAIIKLAYVAMTTMAVPASPNDIRDAKAMD